MIMETSTIIITVLSVILFLALWLIVFLLKGLSTYQKLYLKSERECNYNKRVLEMRNLEYAMIREENYYQWRRAQRLQKELDEKVLNERSIRIETCSIISNCGSVSISIQNKESGI